MKLIRLLHVCLYKFEYVPAHGFHGFNHVLVSAEFNRVADALRVEPIHSEEVLEDTPKVTQIDEANCLGNLSVYLNDEVYGF